MPPDETRAGARAAGASRSGPAFAADVLPPALVLAGGVHAVLQVAFGAVASGRDAVVLAAYLHPAALAGVGAAVALAAHVARAAGCGRALSRRAGRMAGAFIVGAALGVPAAIAWRRPFAWQPADVAALLAVLAGAGVVAWRWSARRQAAHPAYVVLLAAIPLLAWPLGPRVRAPGVPVAAAARSSPVVIVGLDGATWDVVAPLLAAERLPNLGRVVGAGAWSRLRSDPSLAQPFADSPSAGMRTPSLWETIATGQPPRVHGIWDFWSFRLPGMASRLGFRVPRLMSALRPWLAERLVDSGSGRAPRLWEVAARAGLPVRVVGWYATWPACGDAGAAIVSDAAHRREDAVHSGDVPAGEPGAASAADAVLRDVLGDDVGPLLAPAADRVLAANLRQLGLDLARDRYYAEAAERLAAEGGARPALSLHYFVAVDTAQHLFWRFHEPAAFGVGPAAPAVLATVIARVHEEADRLLGRVLRIAGDESVVLVVSDHGGGPWPEAHAAGRSFSGRHRVDGLLAGRGPGIARAGRVPELSLYDVAPTVLHLAALPVDATMPGRVATELLAGEPAARGVRRVPGFGPRTGPACGGVVSRAADGAHRE